MSCDDENKLLLEPAFVVGPLELFDSEGFCLKAAETNNLATTLLPIFKGDKGDAATVSVGEVATVAPDQPAAVTNSGDSANAVLDFQIPKGDIGLSAYEVAVANGFAGTEAEWLASLEGTSAYEVAVANGFAGTEAEWLASLEGPPGANGTGFNYTQASPSDTWTIAHNLGVRPSVSAFTVGGLEMMGSVLHLSANTLQITFNSPVAGTARLN